MLHKFQKDSTLNVYSNNKYRFVNFIYLGIHIVNT